MNNLTNAPSNVAEGNATGVGKPFPLHTAFRYQTTPDLPLMDVPDELFITYTNASRVEYYVQQTVVPMMVVVPAAEVKSYSEYVNEADTIRNEYVLKAVPMRYTIRFLDFASERSKSKTSSSVGESSKLGFTFDASKIFAGESSGEVNLEHQRNFETAFSYYVDQGKKYLIDLAYIKLVETYRDKLIGLDYTYKGKKYKTNTDIAGDWIRGTNVEIAKRLDEHFEKLRYSIVN